MPRRRLSEQQLKRIRVVQDRRRQRLETRAREGLVQPEDEPPRTGLVAVRHGANLAVEQEDGRIVHCVTRRHIGEPVCGDLVLWQATGADTGVVIGIEPRSSVLIRPDYGGRAKAIAANLTQILIVVAPEPAPAGDLLDQYLIAAETIGVRALVICNKTDLLSAERRASFFSELHLYRDIGYPLIPVSVHQGDGLDRLRTAMQGQASMLVGQSGVGKSSIADAMLPDQELQIGRLSQATGLGRHTTSAATCYRLDQGGRLIDSPGVRSFRLPPLTLAELEWGFREFRDLVGRCRFANCGHDAEPGCAVRDAAADGRIAPQRLQAFRRLAAQAERAQHD